MRSVEILERNFIEQKSMVEYFVGGTFKVFTFQAKNALTVRFFCILNVSFGFLIVPRRTIRNVVQSVTSLFPEIKNSR